MAIFALAVRLPTFATLVEVNMVEVTMVTMDKLTMFEVNMVIMVELNVYCLFFSVTDQVTEKGILGSRINLIYYIWCVQNIIPDSEYIQASPSSCCFLVHTTNNTIYYCILVRYSHHCRYIGLLLSSSCLIKLQKSDLIVSP